MGALLTGLYTFRLFFVVFLGEPSPLVREHTHDHVHGEGPWTMMWPVAILAVLSVVGDPLAGVQLTYDLPEALIGQRVGQEDQGAEKAERRWGEADDAPDGGQRRLALLRLGGVETAPRERVTGH